MRTVIYFRTTNKTMNDTKQNAVVDREVLAEIATAIGSIRYGSVEIVIQDGKVIQIERKEKIRFTPGSNKSRG